MKVDTCYLEWTDFVALPVVPVGSKGPSLKKPRTKWRDADGLWCVWAKGKEHMVTVVGRIHDGKAIPSFCRKYRKASVTPVEKLRKRGVI